MAAKAVLRTSFKEEAMSEQSSLSRRKALGIAAVSATSVGLAAVGVSPAQAARGTEYGDALDLLVQARDELMEGGREPSRYQALRHVNMAIHETLQAMREDRRWDNDPRWRNPRYQRWDDSRFR
jgi:hypothetical protein